MRIEVGLAAACVLLGCAGDTRVSRDCTGPSGPADSSYHVTVSTVQAPCSIEFARHFALQTEEQNVSDYSAPMVLLSSGELVTRSSIRDRLSVWTAEGQPSRFVGRSGSGPGEFNYVAAIYRDGYDTLHVGDMPGRWHVYDSELRYVRTNSQLLNEWNDTAFLEDGRVLTGRNSGFPDGPLFFVLDRDGRIVSSFGRALHPNENRRIAYAGDGTFWTVLPTRYAVERWSLQGERQATITRDADWFPPSDAGRAWYPSTGQPNITRLILDDRRRLWVVSAIPVGNDRTSSPSDAWDWVVEVFDTSTGALLASERHDSPEAVPVGRLQDGRFYTLLELEDGTYSAAVGDFSLAPVR